jgi:hypothetical protein
MLMNELERWSNFFIFTAAAAATLIGLLFVVITLGAENNRESSRIRIYLTPTVIYFASVLFLAAILIIPVHSRLSAALCTSVFGVLGLFYTGSLLVRQGIRKNYYEILDLIPYAGLPLLGYGILE